MKPSHTRSLIGLVLIFRLALSPSLCVSAHSSVSTYMNPPSSCRELVPALACALPANCRIHCSTSRPLTCRMLCGCEHNHLSRAAVDERIDDPTLYRQDGIHIGPCRPAEKKLLEFPQPLYFSCRHVRQELVDSTSPVLLRANTDQRLSSLWNNFFFLVSRQ